MIHGLWDVASGNLIGSTPSREEVFYWVRYLIETASVDPKELVLSLDDGNGGDTSYTGDALVAWVKEETERMA